MIYIKRLIVEIRNIGLVKCSDEGKVHPVRGYEGLGRLQSHSTNRRTHYTSTRYTQKNGAV